MGLSAGRIIPFWTVFLIGKCSGKWKTTASANAGSPNGELCELHQIDVRDRQQGKREPDATSVDQGAPAMLGPMCGAEPVSAQRQLQGRSG